MTYTALSSIGPRIAFAISDDLFHWRRLGLATFAPYRGIDFVHVNNKDASVFPVAIANHAGKMQLALLHRPLFQAPGLKTPRATAARALWISTTRASGSPTVRCRLEQTSHSTPGPVQFASPPGGSGCPLGSVESWRGYSSHPDPARLARDLPRSE
jgi:hypothetical protein